MMRLLMLDLGSGLGGASQEMRRRDWRVVTVDINPDFEPDIIADLRKFSWAGERPDLIWASPPCNEFAREFMPWCKTGKPPDMSIVRACKRIIEESRPRYWIIENVRGAISWFKPILGNYREVHGPFYLWGFFPPLGGIKLNMRKKESMSSSWSAERSKIPAALSKAVANAIEWQPSLLERIP